MTTKELDLSASIFTLARSLAPDATVPVPASWLVALADVAHQEPTSPSDTDSKAAMLTVAEAATRLSVAPSYIYRHKDRLPFVSRVGLRALRIDGAKLDRYIAARRIR